MIRNKWGCSFTKTTGTDDLTAASLSDRPFKWSDFTFPTFTYNSETIEAHIVGWAFDTFNTIRYTGLDSNGYYSIGKYLPPTTIATTLEIIPYGKNAFELIRTPLTTVGSRTGQTSVTDVDLVVKCARSANDYVEWTHDKVYCQPFILKATKQRASHERYLLVLSQRGAGSCVPVAKDNYDKSYYEVS
jgi:hypothetical protein